MKIIYICGLIIISIWFFIFYLKKWYLYLAITRVYIPNFKESENEFINDVPLKSLKKSKNNIYLTFTGSVIILTIFFFKTPAFYINIVIFILSFIISIFTFDCSVYENQVFKMFANYLTPYKNEIEETEILE